MNSNRHKYDQINNSSHIWTEVCQYIVDKFRTNVSRANEGTSTQQVTVTLNCKLSSIFGGKPDRSVG